MRKLGFEIALSYRADYPPVFFCTYSNHILEEQPPEKKSKHLTYGKERKLGHTLAELKSTQSQLIQSEKMASLGNSLQALLMRFKTH